MSKAERKSLLSESVSEPASMSSILDGLNVKAVSSRRKPKKTKADGSPTWHQIHRTYRYYLDARVYENVCGVATTLNLENVSSAATILMDFALVMHDQGKVRMETSPNPNPKSNKMLLKWTYQNDGGWGQELKPDPNRKLRHATSLIHKKEKVPTYGFRWPGEFHHRIVKIANEQAVSISAVTNRLLSYATEEYHAGRLKIQIQTVVSNEISGWSSK